LRGILTGLSAAALLTGCLSPLPKNNNPDIPTQVELSTTPFFPQTEFHCGPAALATVLGADGNSISPESLADDLFIPSLEGSLQVEMMAASRRLGYIPVPLESSFQALLDTVASGRTVLLLQNLATPSQPHWHYAVLIGYDTGRNKLALRSGTTQRKEMHLRTFLRTWDWAGRWAVVLLKPGEMIDSVDQRKYFRALADLEQTDQVELTIAAYYGALPYWPESEFLWTGIGSIAYQQGKLEQAENAIRELLKFHPNSVTGRNNLASVLLDKGCTEQALDQITRAEELLDNDQRFSDMVNTTRQEISASISQNGVLECD
jgi:tetratricopeptide (TPR) repeat protein